jgi:LuxR family transcriptional regulator, maltose regulon positive regulatory protein
VYRAALALIAGDTVGTIQLANRAIDLAQPDDHVRRGSAAALVGLAEWTNGDIEDASRHYTDAITELTAAGHISDVLGCALALADMRRAQGRLGDARHVLEDGLALAHAHHVVRGTGDMHAGLADLLVARNDLEGARQHLEAVAQLGEHAGLPQLPYRWRVASAHLHRAEGDRSAALALLQEAEPLYNTDMSPPVRPVSAMRVRAQLDVGDVAAARRWAAASGLSPDDELTYLREYEHVTVARVLLADDAADDAERLLERILAAAEGGGRTETAIEVLVLLSLLRATRGDPAGATTTLGRALQLGESESYVRPFADELPALEPVLRAIPATEPGGSLARTVLAGAAPSAEPPPSPQPRPVPLVDPLSDRELDVLRMLRGELTGPEIARELHVSLNTLRTHTKNIYAKLGATNRREAVRRATELGL